MAQVRRVAAQRPDHRSDRRVDSINDTAKYGKDKPLSEKDCANSSNSSCNTIPQEMRSNGVDWGLPFEGCRLVGRSRLAFGRLM